MCSSDLPVLPSSTILLEVFGFNRRPRGGEDASERHIVFRGHRTAHFVFGRERDTVVAAGRRILPKAEDEATARKCLELLSGRRHRVLSAIALRAPDGAIRERLSETVVMFKRLSSAEIDAYLASGEWEGKAGGYAIQGIAEGLISRIQGSHSGVVGLPLYETRTLLRAAGFDIA